MKIRLGTIFNLPSNSHLWYSQGKAGQIVRGEYFGFPFGWLVKPVKVWTGSAWVEKPVKVWTGSAWVVKPVKVWNDGT